MNECSLTFRVGGKIAFLKLFKQILNERSMIILGDKKENNLSKAKTAYHPKRTRN